MNLTEQGPPEHSRRRPNDGHQDRGGDPSSRPSQRTDGYNGGVQAGTSATSAESASHERALRAAVARSSCPANLVWIPGYSGEDLAALLGADDVKLQGIQPDGGIWIDPETRLPVVAAEAKKQGAQGNAIERWHKNWDVLKRLGVRVYVTFCVGDGFFNDNSAERTIQTAVTLDDPRQADKIWNVPAPRLWMYRYRTHAQAALDMDKVLAAALTQVATEGI